MVAQNSVEDNIPEMQDFPEEADDAVIEADDEGDFVDDLSADIRFEHSDRSLAEFYRWYEEGDLIIDPEWQRNFVWTPKQRSKLIESFILSIPIPVIYLAKTKEEKYEVIDGRQRLTSVFDFLRNDFKLTGLAMLKDINGKAYKDLDQPLQRKFRNATMRSFELDADTDSRIHFEVFERLNTGGTKLKEMEIRNCIFRGKLNNLLKDLALNKDFIAVVNKPGLAKRMDDRSLVLRFLAFHQMTHNKFPGSLKEFLDHFFKYYRNPEEQEVRKYRQAFEKCMKASLSVFGNRGFRTKRMQSEGSKSFGEWSTQPNAAIFQCVSTSFADYDLGQITRSADNIYEAYVELVTTDNTWFNGVRAATGDTNRLKYVFDTWAGRLKDAVSGSVPNDSVRLFTRALKEEMFKQDPTCRICKQKISLVDDAALDHEKHYWRGGATIPENARLVHRYCNFSRSL